MYKLAGKGAESYVPPDIHTKYPNIYMIFGADFECRVQKSGLCAKQWVGLFRTNLIVKVNTSLYILSGYFPGKHAHTYTRL